MMDDYRFQMAWRYYHRNQFDLAIHNLRELLAHEPNNASYHGLLAACLLAQTRIHAAEYELKIALSLDAHDPFFFLIYSRIYILQNKPNLALNSCTEALNLDPENTEALLLKADILLMANKRKEALDCITTAANIEPDNIAVSLAFGDYYQQIGQHHQALEYALQALSYDAGHENAHILMAEVQLALGNTDEAAHHARYSIMQNPESKRALYIFSAIKMRNSLIVGLWWRFNSWMATLTPLQSTIILIGAYVSFNLFAQILFDLGHENIGITFTFTWLAIVIYSWIGIPIYQRALDAELKKFSFNKDF